MLRYKAFLTVRVNIYNIFCRGDLQWAHSTGHYFPVRNDFSQAEQELQYDKRRHWLSHFKRFKLQHKEKHLKNDTSYHLLKIALIKSANNSWTEIFIEWVYTHTLQPQTRRDLQSRFGREKIIQRFKLQQIVIKRKTPKVLTVESFEGAQYANFKHIFI